MRERLLATSFPRIQMVAILILAGLGAFLSSALLLRLGFDGMASRYALAALFGYLAFLGLVRLWISYQQSSLSLDGLDVPDLANIELPNVNLGGLGDGSDALARAADSFEGGGGSFGGAGASGSWGAPESSSSFDLDGVDFDEAWPIVLAVVALLAGVAAVGFVIWSSPIMFAEVLLDAAVVGAVFKRARRRERRHWVHGVLRRTWIPGLLLALFAALGGFALQTAEPQARTLGEVIHANE
ncbi:MAG: hypothetical protein QM778_18130 [Myxococcales bacterium]